MTGYYGEVRGFKVPSFANEVKQSSGFRRKDAALSGLPRRFAPDGTTGHLTGETTSHPTDGTTKY